MLKLTAMVCQHRQVMTVGLPTAAATSPFSFELSTFNCLPHHMPFQRPAQKPYFFGEGKAGEVGFYNAFRQESSLGVVDVHIYYHRLTGCG